MKKVTQMKMRRNWQKSREMTMYFPKANIAVVNNEKSNIKIHLKKVQDVCNTIFTVCDPWGKSGTITNLSVVADPRSSGVARFEVKRRNGSETWLYFLICLRRCQANKRARLGSALDYHCGPRWTMRRGWKSMLRFTGLKGRLKGTTRKHLFGRVASERIYIKVEKKVEFSINSASHW